MNWQDLKSKKRRGKENIIWVVMTINWISEMSPKSKRLGTNPGFSSPCLAHQGWKRLLIGDSIHTYGLPCSGCIYLSLIRTPFCLQASSFILYVSLEYHVRDYACCCCCCCLLILSPVSLSLTICIPVLLFRAPCCFNIHSSLFYLFIFCACEIFLGCTWAV